MTFFINRMPKLSIITVNLNNASGLRKTIESVVIQTFQDYEYLIVDGGSTDGSMEVIKEFSGKIAYWVSEPDKGIYNAMNKGILKAKGEYLQFLNSGDWLVDDKILSIVFKNSRTADIIYGHLNVVFDTGIKLHKSLNETNLSMVYFFNDTIAHPSAFISRRLFASGLYDESFTIAADKKFFIERIVLQNCTIQQIEEPIVNFNTEGLCYNPKYRPKVNDENNKIFTQTIPPRMIRDYEKFVPLSMSPLVEYIPILNKTNRFQIFVVKIVKLLVHTYIFFKSNRGKSN